MIKVAEILDRPEVWWRGDGEVTEALLAGRLCLVTAMSRAVRGHTAFTPGGGDRLLGLDAIENVTGERPHFLNQWNDAPERTFAEVHAVACEIDRLRMLRGEA